MRAFFWRFISNYILNWNFLKNYFFCDAVICIIVLFVKLITRICIYIIPFFFTIAMLPNFLTDNYRYIVNYVLKNLIFLSSLKFSKQIKDWDTLMAYCTAK